MSSKPLFTHNDLKELGFHKVRDLFTEFVYQLEGCKSKLILTPDPLNSYCMFILMPDGSKIQFHPSSIEDVRFIQRMFAFSYYENHAEAWFVAGNESN